MLEREFNNLLALGTDRRLDDVSTKPLPCPNRAGHLFLFKKWEKQNCFSLSAYPGKATSSCMNNGIH